MFAYQTTFTEHPTLRAPTPIRDLDTGTWIWALSLCLIVSATLNIFNYGRHYERTKAIKK